MKLHLINETNQVVRTFPEPSTSFFVIRRDDSLRIEMVTDLNSLNMQNIKYQILQSFEGPVTQKWAADTELKIHGTALKLVHSSYPILQDITLNEDQPELYNRIQKRTALVGLAILILGFTWSQFLTMTEEKVADTEIQPVSVNERIQIVAMSEETPTPTKMIAPTKPIVRKNSAKSAKSASTVKTSEDYLNFLGESTDKKNKPGLNLAGAKVRSAGIGLGGSQGSGGVQSSQFGKGFFKRALGPRTNINGAGGYGTKGAGGGKAGYGSLSIVGSGGTSLLEGLDNEATFEGGLGRDQISAVIHKHINEVRFCYEKGLVNKPELNGKVAIHFLINPKGAVSTAEIRHSSLKESSVESCIKNRLRTWIFPKPVGGVNVKVTYPFVLKKIQDT